MHAPTWLECTARGFGCALYCRAAVQPICTLDLGWQVYNAQRLRQEQHTSLAMQADAFGKGVECDRAVVAARGSVSHTQTMTRQALATEHLLIRRKVGRVENPPSPT